jgi:hypothetical protein
MSKLTSNPGGVVGSGLTTTDRLLQAATALALLLTPVVVAVIGYQATRSSTSKDYVSLAVSILNSKDSPKDSRLWATAVLTKLSPVPVPNELRAQLGSGSVLTAKPITVNVPVAVGCIDPKTYADMHSQLPRDFAIGVKPHSLTDDQLIHLLSRYAGELASWSQAADKMLKICSDYTQRSDALLSKISPKPAG